MGARLSRCADQKRLTRLRVVPRKKELLAIEGWYGDLKLSCRFTDLLSVPGESVCGQLCGDERVAVVVRRSTKGYVAGSCVVILVAEKAVQLLCPTGLMRLEEVQNLFYQLDFEMTPTIETLTMLGRFGVRMEDVLVSMFGFPYLRRAGGVSCEAKEQNGAF